MPKKLSPQKTTALREFLSSSEGQSLTLAEIATRFGVSVWAVHRMRHSLADQKSPVSGNELIARAIEDAEHNPRAFIDRVMGGQATMLSPDQQRAVLSELILHTPNPAIKVSAQNALTRLDSQSGTAAILGPGVPLTEDGRVDRLALLMSACGLPTIRRALAKAFPNARALQKSLDSIDAPSEAVGDEPDLELASRS